MPRIIPIQVENEFVKGSGVVVGAEGSHDDVLLEITFNGMWAGLTKRIVWLDALGGNPTITMLPASMLKPGTDNVYLVPIPGEPKAYEGSMTMSIKGAAVDGDVESRATMSADAEFKVLPSSWTPNAEESDPVSPSQAEQLQAAIDSLKGDTADQINTHNTNPDSHQDIRDSIGTEIAEHNAAPISHADIREAIATNTSDNAETAADLAQHKADQSNPHGVTAAQAGADPSGTTTAADCFDEAASPTSAPTTWYVPKDLPRPSGEVGMMIDVRWKNGHADSLGYDVSLVWGAPDGAGNETIVEKASVSAGLTGQYSIPAEGTVRYQLIEQSGRLRWRYVSGTLIPRQFSTDARADEADKTIHGMEIEYLPGMEIYVQMDNGNTADVMRLVPDAGPTLPVYGNGKGAKTGEIPAGYILHLVSAGDHWQIINGGGSGGGATLYVTATGSLYPSDTSHSAREIFDFYEAGGNVLLVSEAPLAQGLFTPTWISDKFSTFVRIVYKAIDEANYEIDAIHITDKSDGTTTVKYYTKEIPRIKDDKALNDSVYSSERTEERLRETLSSAKEYTDQHGGVTPEQLNEAKHTTLNVEIEDDGFGGYRADKNDNDINNHRNAGGIVQAKYYDSSKNQTYTYYYSTMESDRKPTFIRTYIEDGKVKQVLASVGNDNKVTLTRRTADTVTAQQLSDAIGALGTVFDYKGAKPSKAQLPSVGNKTGDVWFVEDESVGYIWLDSGVWEPFGPAIDLSGYLKKTSNGTAGQFAVSDGKGGVTWRTIPDAKGVSF